MSKRITNSFLYFLAIGLLIYTFLRADNISLTCDEASTFFSHLPRNLWTCFTSESCWSDANNHWLNSLLMQWSIAIFGVAEWTLRLPNMLAHVIYLFFSIQLIQQVSKNFWLQLVGFCLLNLNPFLLEFFALARGYGLGVGWMMMSIYFLFLWIKNERLLFSGIAFLAAALAVLSNFVFLNYFAALVGVVGVFIFIKILQNKFPAFGKIFFQQLSIPFVFASVLFFLLLPTIQTLRAKGEFVFGVESFWETFQKIVQNSLMSQGYLHPHTQNVFVLLSIVLAGFSAFFGVYFFWKNFKKSKPMDATSRFYFAAVLLLILMILGLVIQYHWLEVKYLVDRKAVILIPLFSILVFLYFEKIYKKNQKWGMGLAMVFALFFGNHFYRTSNLKIAREWAYDAYTKDMIVHLSSVIPENETAQLEVYWIFEPASHFYKEYLKIENLKTIRRIHDEDLGKISEADFIYVRDFELPKIPDVYIEEKRFGDQGILLKRK